MTGSERPARGPVKRPQGGGRPGPAKDKIQGRVSDQAHAGLATWARHFGTVKPDGKPDTAATLERLLTMMPPGPRETSEN